MSTENIVRKKQLFVEPPSSGGQFDPVDADRWYIAKITNIEETGYKFIKKVEDATGNIVPQERFQKQFEWSFQIVADAIKLDPNGKPAYVKESKVISRTFKGRTGRTLGNERMRGDLCKWVEDLENVEDIAELKWIGEPWKAPQLDLNKYLPDPDVDRKPTICAVFITNKENKKNSDNPYQKVTKVQSIAAYVNRLRTKQAEIDLPSDES